MARDRDARVRERAHEIWEKEGQPDGAERRHWEQASREIDQQEAASGSGTAVKRKTAPAKRKATIGTKLGANPLKPLAHQSAGEATNLPEMPCP